MLLDSPLYHLNLALLLNYQILLKNIKHDLINPINAMIGYSEFILESLNEKKDSSIINDIKSIFLSSNDILNILHKIFKKKI